MARHLFYVELSMTSWKNRNTYSSVWMELFKIASKVRKAKHDNNNQMFIFEIWKKAKVENSHSWKYFSTEEYSEHVHRKTRTFNGYFCAYRTKELRKKIFYLICLTFYAFNQILWFYGTSILVFRAGTFRVKLFHW